MTAGQAFIGMSGSIPLSLACSQHVSCLAASNPLQGRQRALGRRTEAPDLAAAGLCLPAGRLCCHLSEQGRSPLCCMRRQFQEDVTERARRELSAAEPSGYDAAAPPRGYNSPSAGAASPAAPTTYRAGGSLMVGSGAAPPPASASGRPTINGNGRQAVITPPPDLQACAPTDHPAGALPAVQPAAQGQACVCVRGSVSSYQCQDMSWLRHMCTAHLKVSSRRPWMSCGRRWPPRGRRSSSTRSGSKC